MTHIDYLLRLVPNLSSLRILDVGSGRGGFLVDAAKRGMRAVGVEINPKAIARAHERAEGAGVSIEAKEGRAEALPFPDASFDFANVCEVLEHVPSPSRVLSEVARVLSSTGVAYVSIPNRFGFFDPHYHVPFVNWLPRAWSFAFLRFLGKEKDLSQSRSGHQLLSEMHYMTQDEFRRLCLHHGFRFKDSREQKLKRFALGALLIPFYRLFAFLFVSTFHGIAEKHPTLSNDALFESDSAYLPSGEYYAYRDASAPRILAPIDDEEGKEFAVRLIAGGSRAHTLLSQTLLRERVLLEGSPLLSDFIASKWQSFGKTDSFDVSSLRITKFCQRVAGPHTKVLFLATYNGEPLAVLKMMRSDVYNERLIHERKAQGEARSTDTCRAPRVFADGHIGTRYIYAEEPLVDARSITQKEAQSAEEAIINFVHGFPKTETISARSLGKMLRAFVPSHELKAEAFLFHLEHSSALLFKGDTHGDIGSPNILKEGTMLYLIDWERAGQEPFWLIDAVYFSARLRRIGSLADWQARGRSAFMKHAGVDEVYADALFCLKAVLSVLRKRYPNSYEKALQMLIPNL